MNNKNYCLLFIVIAQFCCTSIWFAGNAVIDDLVLNFGVPSSAIGHLTSSVQLGFITGTLVFALLSIADRYSPSKVFFYCAMLGAICNLSLLLPSNGLLSLLGSRFLVGFWLAGIYPVGMKIAADYFDKGLGKSLGYLVGALVLGTAFPHLIRASGGDLSWKLVIIMTSIHSTFGAFLILLFVPDGPYRKIQSKMNFNLIPSLFKKKSFRIAAFGYFGHMWELYSFWTFLPLILRSYFQKEQTSDINISFYTFIIIAFGSLGCILGGYLSQKIGAKSVAFGSLLASCTCCLAFPIFNNFAACDVFITFLMLWGLVVIADSPLFSTLVAQNADPSSKATALTIANCIGFSITIFSIQLLNKLSDSISSSLLYTLLALGPILSLLYWSKSKTVKEIDSLKH